MSCKTNIARFLFISVLGVLLHFTYDWSGKNMVVGLFSAVNESTWEHLKLLFFPMLLLTLLEVLFFSDRLPENYLTARTAGILSGMLFIVVVFYTLLGVLGKNYDVLNILLYFGGVFTALWTEQKLSGKQPRFRSASAAVLVLLTIAFFVFTYQPPELGLFIDPTQLFKPLE